MDTTPPVAADLSAVQKNRSVTILRRCVVGFAVAGALLLTGLVLVRQGKKAEAEQALIVCGPCCVEGKTGAKSSSPARGGAANAMEVSP